jgi:primosomal replication protein N
MSDRRFPFINRVVISGTVARKLALRTNKSGVATLKLPLTVSLPTLSDDMTRQRLSTIRVSVFIVGQLAVSCERLLTTGAEIIVEGRLSSPPAHGSVSRLEVHAERVQLVDSDGALQFLEKDFLEQNSSQVATAATDSANDSVTETAVSVESKSDSVKKAEPSAVAKSEASAKPRPARTRRKRPVVSAESGAVSAGESVGKTAVELTATDKPMPRRRRSVKKRSATRDSEKKSAVSAVFGSSSPEASGKDAESAEKQKPASSKRKPSGRKPTGSRKTERRPRSVVKDGESIKTSGKSKDSQKTSASKPSSDSPFELVESKDSFDPFLLED